MDLHIENNVFLFGVKDGVYNLIDEGHNLTTNAGKIMIISGINPNITSGHKLTHIEVGTGTTDPHPEDTELVTSTARSPINGIIDHGTNRIYVFTNFSSGDINVNIREVGLFGASTDDDALGDGILVARSLRELDNTQVQQDLLIVWSVTIG